LALESGWINVECPAAGGRFGLGPRVDGNRFLRITGHAVWIGEHKSRFVRRVGLEIENAAGKHVRRDDIELKAVVDVLALQPEERKRIHPSTFPNLAIGDGDGRVSIVIAVDEPLETEID